MKVSLLVAVAAMVLAVADAQFRLPNLFSGLRLFGRPRPRRPRPPPRPQTLFISPGQQFSPQSEQSNFIPQSAPATSFLPVGQDVRFQSRPETFQSRPAPRPAPRPSQPIPRPPAPRPTQQPPRQPPSQVFVQRPQPPLRPFDNDDGEFGAPKQESLLSTSTPFRPSLRPRPVQTFSEDNRVVQPAITSPRRPEQTVVFSNEASSTNFKVTNENENILEPFPNPLPPQNDNNIIGMLPPPPPSSTTSTSTTAGAVILTRPPPIFSVTSPPATFTTNTQLSTESASLTPRPDDIVVTPPNTNSIVPLVLNPVPLVNAGVLPLAGEISNEAQFFPPFNQNNVATVNSALLNSEREQRQLFPPFTSDDRPNELFPPFTK